MLELYILRTVEKIAEAYNTSGMPESLRGILEDTVIDITHAFGSSISVVCDCKKMYIITSDEHSTDELELINDIALDEYLDNVDFLDLVD